MLLHIVRLCGWTGGESGGDLTRALGDQIGLQGVLRIATQGCSGFAKRGDDVARQGATAAPLL